MKIFNFTIQRKGTIKVPVEIEKIDNGFVVDKTYCKNLEEVTQVLKDKLKEFFK